MIPRLPTANENHWEREGTTSVVPQDRRTLKEALASEGYLSALRYVQKGTSGAKALSQHAPWRHDWSRALPYSLPGRRALSGKIRRRISFIYEIVCSV